MTKTQVMALLKANRDARGEAHWLEHVEKSGGLKSFGIGLTKLRKLAKEVGKDSKLADTLWKSDVYDARIIAILIDDPKTMTAEKAERWVGDLRGGYLAHTYSSCGAPLAKTAFAEELAERWTQSDCETRVRCGYGLMYELSKSKKKTAPSDETFLAWVKRIDKTWKGQNVDVLCAMASALMGMGMRKVALHGPALKVAKKIGPIDFDERGKCDPLDVVKHLEGDFVKKKLGI